MAFNSAAIEEFKDIWVFCEQRDGKLMNTDFELISEGRKLADERGSKLVGILLGEFQGFLHLGQGQQLVQRFLDVGRYLITHH